jgi:hypothetical protein
MPPDQIPGEMSKLETGEAVVGKGAEQRDGNRWSAQLLPAPLSNRDDSRPTFFLNPSCGKLDQPGYWLMRLRQERSRKRKSPLLAASVTEL